MMSLMMRDIWEVKKFKDMAENRKKKNKELKGKTFVNNLWSRTPKKINGSYPKLTGIDRKFKEAELDADYNAMSDYYEDYP